MSIAIQPFHRGNWVGTTEIARQYKRAPITVRHWCYDGTLVEFGFRVYQDAKRRWWISPPPERNERGETADTLPQAS